METQRITGKIDRKMKAMIISCVYPPEPVVSSETSAQIAEGLLQNGFEGTVVAPFPNRPG